MQTNWRSGDVTTRLYTVEVTDPSLIGGMQIQVGDTLYDLSLKTRLQNIKQQLLARSSHEIQRGRDRIGT